jgi:ribosomal protein S18 acetylase RimI-like enzyme
MPVVHDPSGGRRLLDAAGATIARFEQAVRDGRPTADLFAREPGVTVDDAAAAVLADLPGWRIAGDEELGRALVAAGGTPMRHGHMYSRNLKADPPPRTWDEPPGIRLTDIDRPVADLLAARRAAYAPDHPDRAFIPEDDEAELQDVVYGGQFGPLLAGSGLAVAADGAVLGAIILGTIPGDPPKNGPWVIDIFRVPGHRGVGRALLQRALALATVDALGLIVTDGNDAARALYESQRFVLLASALVVQL